MPTGKKTTLTLIRQIAPPVWLVEHPELGQLVLKLQCDPHIADQLVARGDSRMFYAQVSARRAFKACKASQDIYAAIISCTIYIYRAANIAFICSIRGVVRNLTALTMTSRISSLLPGSPHDTC